MHIPDGFLGAGVAAGTWAAGAGTLGWALRAEKALPERVPAGTLGALSAFVFAAQLVNVPLVPGTSGHLVGGMLAAAIVGPSRGLVVMAVVLAVQALLFQDGGVTAFGANLLAMGGAGCLGGHAVASLVARFLPGVRGLVAGPVAGAFVGTLLGAAFIAMALALSGLYPASAVLPLLLSLHVPIALLEAALTGAILATVLRWRPDLVRGLQAGARPPPAPPRPWRARRRSRGGRVPGADGLAVAGRARVRRRAAGTRRRGARPLAGARARLRAAVGRARARRHRARRGRGHPGRGCSRLGALARARCPAGSGASPVTPSRPGLVLGAGLALTVLAALAPAGLARPSVPPWSWGAWGLAFAGGAAAFRLAGSTLAQLVRRLAWLLPFVLVLALPAALLAPPGRRLPTALALAARSLAATTAAAGAAFLLGPLGLVRGARALRVPARLVDVLEAALSSLAAMIDQARAMLRAREARRTTHGPWGSLLTEPASTVRGFGRFAGALLLRTLERAEAVERARLARGADLP